MGFGIIHITHFFGHAPPQHHCARKPRGLLNIPSGAVGDIFLAIFDDLCRFSGHRHGELFFTFRFMPIQTVNFRQRHNHAQGTTTRDNCGFVYRITLWKAETNNRMPRFMIGGFFLLICCQHHTASLSTHHHFVFCVLKIHHIDNRATDTRRHQGRFVHKVGKIRPRKSWCAACNQTQIHIWTQRGLARMHVQNFLTALDIGIWHGHLTVKATRTQKGWIKNITPVRCSQNDHTFIRVKTVHFHQKLVQGLFALVVAPAISSTTVTPNGVNFIDKHNTWRVLFGLLEHIAHAACTDTYKHFNKIRP